VKFSGKNAIKDCGGKHSGTILVFLCVLFALSLFKNISYPLFWADESMTVMGGVRVLEYGYPKVHDGKNVLYDLKHPDLTLGIDEKTDAYIGGANWGHYYVAAVGVKLAELTDDIFAKTAVIRTIFALIGLAGLAIFAFIASQFFDTRSSKVGFLILFTFLELLSVPLVLHLREARYYPLTVFLVALSVFVFTQYRILNKTKYQGYLVLMTISLFFLFFTFSPAYFIFLATISIFETAVLTKDLFQRNREGKHCSMTTATSPSEKPFMRWLRSMLPITISLISVAPLLYFFRIFHIAEEMAKLNTLQFHMDGVTLYLNNLRMNWSFFASFDYIYLAIFLKLIFLVLFALRLLDKSLSAFDIHKMSFSNFLTILFIVYFIAIAKIPNDPYIRYFIPLLPVLAMIIILDATLIYNFISQWRAAAAGYCKGLLIFIFTGFVLYNLSTNVENIRGHIYELTHQYKGPLDYVIPYIKEKYATPDKLVIATNYEETSLMYYLDAKVTYGYVLNNFAQDQLLVPDIIIFREGWPESPQPFVFYLNSFPYTRITFPVINSPVNNIPELNCQIKHRFRTEEPVNERAKMDIYLRM
jgi:uncharacterized membrane protein YuzA (DUF378 family)